MSLKELQTDINSQTVKNFKKLLAERKKSLLNDNETISELFSLKNFLLKFEDFVIESRSRKASKKLSQMTEEERRMLSMTPDEKKFFLQYKAKNPENPWSYFKEYQKKLQKEYKLKQKKLA
jgi:recombinational DNA repair ATPase RecF